MVESRSLDERGAEALAGPLGVAPAAEAARGAAWRGPNGPSGAPPGLWTRRAHLLMKRRTPATIARTASTSPLWAKLTLRKGAVNTPNRTSQAARTIIPRSLGAFITSPIGSLAWE